MDVDGEQSAGAQRGPLTNHMCLSGDYDRMKRLTRTLVCLLYLHVGTDSHLDGLVVRRGGVSLLACCGWSDSTMHTSQSMCVFPRHVAAHVSTCSYVHIQGTSLEMPVCPRHRCTLVRQVYITAKKSVKDLSWELVKLLKTSLLLSYGSQRMCVSFCRLDTSALVLFD